MTDNLRNQKNDFSHIVDSLNVYNQQLVTLIDVADKENYWRLVDYLTKIQDDIIGMIAKYQKIADKQENYEKWYVWYHYRKDCEQDIFWLPVYSNLEDAAKMLCNHYGFNFSENAEFGGLNITNGTLNAINED